MDISEKLYRALLECKWFSNCGSNDGIEYDFEIYLVKNEAQCLKNIRSIKWNHVYMNEQGNLTGYLHMNHKKVYNEFWNKEIENIKKDYLPSLIDAIKMSIEEKGYDSKIIKYVEYNLIIMMMADFYSDFYKSNFWKMLLEIYLSGHIPCGWHGKYPEGEIMVF